MRPQRTLWPVDMRTVMYRGDVDAQATAIAEALARDTRTLGDVHWRHAPLGSRWAEDGAVVLRCWIPAADAADAELVGNALMDRAVEGVINRHAESRVPRPVLWSRDALSRSSASAGRS